MWKRLAAEFLVEPEASVSQKFLTWPNLVTGIGIVLTGIYCWQFFSGAAATLIPITVFLVGLSDLLDGLLARRLNQHSRLGKIIDPLRDRLLGFAMLINAAILKGAGVLFSAPVLIIVAVETIIFLPPFLRLKVHAIGKLRQMIYLACMWLFLAEVYWLKSEIAPLAVFLWVMAAASLSAFAVYIRKLRQ